MLLVLGSVIMRPALGAEHAQFIKFTGQALENGRELWLQNCKGCHAYGTAGAPVPMRADQWEFRVSKPRAILYDHAINGFFGPDDTMMPERGGNPELSDEQVKLAVDYMLTLAGFYIDKQVKNP
jgi:cytochrome c5